jgi:phenylacetate-CoA ligase
MTDSLLRVYHRLPTPFRSAAASARGLYLNYWRYGSNTEGLVEEALSRENWSPAQWKAWQEERLTRVLHRAATQVPYYREQWAARRRKGDRASWEYLDNWPILEKEPIRQNPRAFVSTDCNPRLMFLVPTSGTSGTPLTLWWSLATTRSWYALFEARGRYWNGVSRHNRWAMLGGQLVIPVSQRQPPYGVWNSGLSQLYMSSYHLAPHAIKDYFDEMQRRRVTYVFGYTSSLYALAQGAMEAGVKNVRMTVAMTNAEPVYDYQRSAIEEAFQCPVRETYGMAEIVVAASECAAKSLHLWPEVGWVEVVEGDKSSPSGSTGDLICTGLLNADMPLIRYRTGDRGALEEQHGSCECGRTLPKLASLEGRADEVLFTMDGRCVGRFPIFRADLPIREAQIIQEALNRVRIRYVPTGGCTKNHENLIVQRVRARMGAVNVIMEPLDEVPRGPNGKFRLVVCRLSREEREYLMGMAH